LQQLWSSVGFSFDRMAKIRIITNKEQIPDRQNALKTKYTGSPQECRL
jgi:hypothetical protein